ncbi:hypothetical protein AYM40_10360 [Paraburkholderia phytofirmans OLGA172]|uniref:Uncharacterized protein n=1 Tax=Paraburkholderia phytofirmans OLGA172 TaxID=1417228 RepID=A0A167VYK4_9BURK|nr:hypothetical protein AYM40_10360 [Paraburkholderia phytofirmans OLGA172]
MAILSPLIINNEPMRAPALPLTTKHGVWPVRVVAFTLFLITGAVNLQAPLYATYARASHMGRHMA